MATTRPVLDVTAPFSWRDGERIVRFGRDCLAHAPELLGEGYALLTTERALAAAPALAAHARSVHHVPPGRVDALAAGLRDAVQGELLVALGGGRVIDTAKALAAADPPRRVAAVPTTLSGAEMTRLHRHARGSAPGTPFVRPAIVICDPALSASQPLPALAASAANALAHAVEASLTTQASPVPTLAAHEAVRLLAAGSSAAQDAAQPDQDRLALGALLAGYAVDASGYGLHHVLAQTLVRETGVGHGLTNAALLPHTTRALAARSPELMAQLDASSGGDVVSLAARLATLADARRLRDLGVAPERLGVCADAAAARAELALTPPEADRAELLALYEAAW